MPRFRPRPCGDYLSLWMNERTWSIRQEQCTSRGLGGRRPTGTGPISMWKRAITISLLFGLCVDSHMAMLRHLHHHGHDRARPGHVVHHAAGPRPGWIPVAGLGAMALRRQPLAQRRNVGLLPGRPRSRLLRLGPRVASRSSSSRSLLQQQPGWAVPSLRGERLVRLAVVDGCIFFDMFVQPCVVVTSTVRPRPRRRSPSPQACMATRDGRGSFRRASRGPWWPLVAGAYCDACSAWVGSNWPFSLRQPTLVDSPSAWLRSTLPSHYAGLHCAVHVHPRGRSRPGGGMCGTSPMPSRLRRRRPTRVGTGVGTPAQEPRKDRSGGGKGGRSLKKGRKGEGSEDGRTQGNRGIRIRQLGRRLTGEVGYLGWAGRGKRGGAVEWEQEIGGKGTLQFIQSGSVGRTAGRVKGKDQGGGGGGAWKGTLRRDED